MKKAKRALALFLSTLMLMSCLYIGGNLGFMADSIKAYAADKNSASAFNELQDENSPRLELNFNKNWKFALGNQNDAQNDIGSYDDSSWRTVNLPHDFSIEQEFTANERTERESGNLPGGTGWYRKTFSMPISFKGRRVVLNFDGSYNETTVYVNGQKVGENFYGYNNFSVDITNYLRYDRKNVIAVKVESFARNSRWYSGAGLYRDVTMTITNPVHVALYGTHVDMPNLANDRTDGTTVNTVTVENTSNEAALVSVKNTLHDANGISKAETRSDVVKIEASSAMDVPVTFKIKNPLLWDTKNPNLYTLRTEVLINNDVVDVYDTEIGYRWINWDKDAGFSLNGVPTKIEGVCLHHDQGALGAVQNRDAIVRQVKILKDMGANAIRTSHNVASKVLLDVCNEEGILVMEEFFDGLDRYKNSNDNDFGRFFSQKMSADGAKLIGGSTNMKWSDFVVKQAMKRDRNDPSIIIWSMANEINFCLDGSHTWDSFKNIAIHIQEIVNSLDTTRPLTLGNNQGAAKNGADKVDSVMDVVGGNYSPKSWVNAHSTYMPNKPFIATESTSSVNSRGVYKTNGPKKIGTGGLDKGGYQDATGAEHLSSYDINRVDWGQYAAEAWAYAAENAWFSGEFVWTGFDYIGEPTPWNDTEGNGGAPFPNSSYFGIIDTAGFGKDSYYLYRSMWNEDANTLHLVPGTWNSDNLTVDGGFVNVAVYSNAAKIELLRDGNIIATAKSTNHNEGGYTYKTWTETVVDSGACNANAFNTEHGGDFYAQFRVKHSGNSLSVKAYDANGKQITDAEGTQVITRDNTATKIVANVWNNDTQLTSDGKSLAYVEFTAVDENGNTVNNYNSSLQFTLTGNGKIVGVDNGNQATVNKFQSRTVLDGAKKSANIKMFNGKALVIIESTEDSGEIRLSTSPADSIKIEVKNDNKLFRSAGSDVVLNSVPEEGKETVDEFEEIVPQLVKEQIIAPNPDVNNDGYIELNAKPTDGNENIKVVFTYPTNIWLDKSENDTLEKFGYKVTYKGSKSTYGSNTDYRVIIFPGLWGGNNGGTYAGSDVLWSLFDSNNPNTGNHLSVKANKHDDGGWNDTEGWGSYEGASAYADRYAYEDVDISYTGTPNKLGDYTYSAKDNGKADGSLLVQVQWYKNWISGWQFRGNFFAKKDGAKFTDASGNPNADVKITAHICDKTNLRKFVDVEHVKPQNETYKNLLISGNWNAFVNAYDASKVENAKNILATREVTDSQVKSAENALRPAVDAANQLVYKAPLKDEKNLKDKITEAENIINASDFEKKYTHQSKEALKDKFNEIKSSDYITHGVPEHRIDINNFDSINAGYQAHSDMLALQQLLKELQQAIDALQEDAQKTVKATLFKYGYNNNETGNARYTQGGIGMNRLAKQQAKAYISANYTDFISTTLQKRVDEGIGGLSGYQSDWYKAREEARALDAYASYYALSFTGEGVSQAGNIGGTYDVENYTDIPETQYANASWNLWAKRGTQAPSEEYEEGASVQGLASPRLVTGPNGGKYFESHPNYTTLPYKNISDKAQTTLFRINPRLGSGYEREFELPQLENISVFSPDLFRKEAILNSDLNNPTSKTKGDFAKYYWDTELPLKTTTRDGSNYFEYDSSNTKYMLQTTFNDDDHTAVMEYKDTPNGWSVKTGTSGVDNHGFFPFNYQNGSTATTGENAIYHYGLTFDTDFRLTESGRNKNGEDIIFEFTGDDDVYVYIDDVLVLDNGGIHGARKSTINFTNESVSYQYAMDVSEGVIKQNPKNEQGEIVYKYGTENPGISADNRAAVNKLHEIKTDKDSHTLTFFFLERGSNLSNCGIKFNIPAASEDVKLNRQSYAVDYDANLNMNLKENDEISDRANRVKQTYVGIAYMNNYGTLPHDTLEFEDQMPSPLGLDYSFEENGGLLKNKIEFSTDFGDYKFHNDGKLEFKAKTMNYDSQDYFYVVSRIEGDPSFSANAVYYYYEPVTVSPATAVYYEDNSNAIHYTDGHAADNSGNGIWKTIGNKSTQDELNLNKAVTLRGEGNYGFNEGYKNFNTYSADAAHNVKVSAKNAPNNGGTYPVAEFDFAGTGFDVISATKNTTGTVKVEVKNNETGAVVARKMVDTYYNQQFGQLYQTADGTITLTAEGNTPVYFSVNNAYTTNPTHYETVDGVEKIIDGAAQDGQKAAIAYGWLTADNTEGTNTAIYQAPVIKIDNLPYGKYHVKMTVTYTPAYAHGNNDYDFILDAVKVYDPVKPSNKMTNGLHEYQAEGHPVRLELRDKLIGSETVTAEQNGVLMFNGAPLESKALKSFTDGCPKNEVYLTNGTAVAFHLWAKAEPLHAKLGAKLANGANGGIKVTVGDKTNNINLNTATDMYYRLENINWTKDGEWYKSELITIENLSAATVSLTNAELTFEADSQAQLNKANTPAAKFMVTAATPKMFTAVMNRADANLKLKLDNVSVVLDDNGKSAVTILLTSSADVDRIIVKNDDKAFVDANVSSKVNGSTKTWTVKFTQTQAGKHTYTVEAVDASGYNGSEDPLEVTFKAKKAPIGFKAVRAVKSFFDKLFGRR